VIRDCFGIVGLIAIAVGLDMISRPWAIIFAGVSLVACALFAPDRSKKKTGN
jgi:hypothetical protein